MDLTDLKYEGNLEEVGEEPVEQCEGGPDLMLPEERGGQARFGDDMRELAQADIDMDTRRVEDPPPLPSCSVWLDE
jgi:hypothetical protein